jgi:hypothetical protein
VIRASSHCHSLTYLVRLYNEAFATFATSFKAALPTSLLLVSLNTDQSATIEKAVFALSSFADQLQGVSAASKDFHAFASPTSAAYDHINECLQKAPTSRLADSEDGTNQKLDALSTTNAEFIGKYPRPSPSSEVTRIAKWSWDQLADAEKARKDSYDLYRRLQNTVSCLSAIQPNLNMFLDSRSRHEALWENRTENSRFQ